MVNDGFNHSALIETINEVRKSSSFWKVVCGHFPILSESSLHFIVCVPVATKEILFKIS